MDIGFRRKTQQQDKSHEDPRRRRVRRMPKIVNLYMDGHDADRPEDHPCLSFEEINKGFDLMLAGESVRSAVVLIGLRRGNLSIRTSAGRVRESLGRRRRHPCKMIGESRVQDRRRTRLRALSAVGISRYFSSKPRRGHPLP